MDTELDAFDYAMKQPDTDGAMVLVVWLLALALVGLFILFILGGGGV